MTHLSSIRIPRGPALKGGLFARIRAAVQLGQERADLRALSDDQLRDIGHTRYEAETEADRPVWDAPSRWRR